MKATKLFKIALSLTVLFLFSSCTQDDDFMADDTRALDNTLETFKILPLDHSEVRSVNYDGNYGIESESTSFNIEKDILHLEIPVPVNDFSFLRAYNVSTNNNAAILYVIQREKQNVVINYPTTHVIQDELRLSDLNINTQLLKENGCIRVYVMNTSETDLLIEEDDRLNCFIDTLDNYSCGDNLIPSECFNNPSDSRRPFTGGSGDGGEKDIIK